MLATEHDNGRCSTKVDGTSFPESPGSGADPVGSRTAGSIVLPVVVGQPARPADDTASSATQGLTHGRGPRRIPTPPLGGALIESFTPDIR